MTTTTPPEQKPNLDISLQNNDALEELIRRDQVFIIERAPEATLALEGVRHFHERNAQAYVQTYKFMLDRGIVKLLPVEPPKTDG
jgi:hypothetical protein